MLKIRAAQFNALTDAQWKLLSDRLQDHLRTALPEEYQRTGPAKVQKMAENCVSTGRECGLRAEIEFFRLFNLMVLFGEEAWAEPWVKSVLQDFYLQPPEKIRALEKECRARGYWS